MKLFQVIINYDAGGSAEYTLEATHIDEVYSQVYAEIGYDPGEVYVEELPPEDAT